MFKVYFKKKHLRELSVLSALAFLYKKVRKTVKEREFFLKFGKENSNANKARIYYCKKKKKQKTTRSHTSTGEPTGSSSLHHLSSVIPIFWKTVNRHFACFFLSLLSEEKKHKLNKNLRHLIM